MQPAWWLGTSTTGPIFSKPLFAELNDAFKNSAVKNSMDVPSLGIFGTMSSSCFLFILMLLCAHLACLSNEYQVRSIHHKTECWRIFYEKVLFCISPSQQMKVKSSKLNIQYIHPKNLLYKIKIVLTFQPIMFKSWQVATRVVNLVQFTLNGGNIF